MFSSFTGSFTFGKRKKAVPIAGLYSFSTFTFTAGNTTGRTGPNLATLQSAYSAQTWASNTSYFNMTTQGYQRWTVPITGTYTIRAAGSRAGKHASQIYASGDGAIIEGQVSLTQGDILEIICGQYLDTTNGSVATYAGLGGGGGSFVNNATASTLLFAAGGGGGACTYGSTTPTGYAGENGRTSTSGGPGNVPNSGVGGTGGSGGGIYTTIACNYRGGSGGGWTGNGKNGDNTAATVSPGGTYGGGGFGYPSGFIGGTYGTQWSNPSTWASTYGGFGGGGGGNGIISGGAGGGYSGGGVSSANTYIMAAGGGGSFIHSSATNISTSDGNYDGVATFNGAAISNLASFNSGAGYVTITKV